MGKYRDHRSPRHGYEEDQSSSPESPPEPIYFQRPRNTASASLEAEVTWFSVEKGFGFVKALDGSVPTFISALWKLRDKAVSPRECS